MLHMTETRKIPAEDEWYVICRCGWLRTGFTSQPPARDAGDGHLAEFNRAGEVHVFQPGSGPLPDSDPEACDECGEREDHWRHYVPDPSLEREAGDE